ncbi:hypothetical protein [Larsenimonas suaedae]|uniref:Single-stranded DNA-binding protein n=1 Tax=Larsenimonas suaedae TaxID=1851019 RepID=A0ABU1GZP9_9GAMM|nr:hypothetical protein [Larsenimonas suaedae]MCM2973801.1 hypothetical protein [Larsenimonas suaedae]MDR5897325.1 hypothetical protein [Larsenimonas suaedae]
MSQLSALASSDQFAPESDSLGSSGPVDSGLYDADITMAFIQKSKGGALGVTLHAQLGNREHRETIYVTSGDAKGNKTYYEKDGKQFPLPGFQLMTSICLLTVGKELNQIDTEQKVVKLYSRDAGGEVPTQVDMLTPLLGQKIKLGLIKQIEDKNQFVEGQGYLPTGETRELNVIDKAFRAADNMTVAEIYAQATDAEFFRLWADKWAGETRNRAKGASNSAGASGMPGGVAAGAQQAAQQGGGQRKSLFG